jgi:hypothetical protein
MLATKLRTHTKQQAKFNNNNIIIIIIIILVYINHLYSVLPSFRKATIRLTPGRHGDKIFSIKLHILFTVILTLN